MTSMEKINVMLYGGKGIFGGKEVPLRAEIIYCDKSSECSEYKKGKCLKIAGPSAYGCKHGKLEVIKGYTSRAKKYNSFKFKYKEDEKYGNLKDSSSSVVAVIGEDVYIKSKYAILEKVKETGEYVVSCELFRSGFWIPKSELTADRLYQMCVYRPRALMGGEITSYRKDVVPDIVLNIRRELPELYKEFIGKYSEFDVEPNYIGKRVYISTMVNGSKLYDNGEFTLDKTKDKCVLVCDNWNGAFMPFGGENAKIEINVTDDMKYRVTNNEQVDEDTKFD